MDKQTIGKIILARVLEMPLGKYLAFLSGVTQDKPQRTHTDSHLVKKQIYAAVLIRQGRLFFRVSDNRLVKMYSTHCHTDDKVVCSMKWINTRNMFSLHILKSLLHHQRRYWLSSDEAQLEPLTLKQFLSLYPLQYLDVSRLSRLLPKLFVLTPYGETICLKNLFPSPKRVYAYRIKELIHSSQVALKDKEIQYLLSKEGIHLSLRTICNCRKLLNIPNHKERAAHYYGKDIAFSGYMKLSEKKFNRIPAEPGAYELSIPVKLNYARHKSDVIYIGSSRDLRKRIASYSGNGVKNARLSRFLKKYEVFVRFCCTEHYRVCEKELLKNFKENYGELPKCNKLVPSV
ncbi:MAG: hypothetical protein ACP5JH_02865 [Bacteroidota bacterium]